MNRGNEALTILDALINENEVNKANAVLYVVRAGINIRENKVSGYKLF